MPNGVTAPSYNTNGKSTTVTFHGAGNYSFLATVTNGQGFSRTAPVSVTVNRTATTIAISPPSATVVDRGTQGFAAVVDDQFGAVIASPSLTWSVNSGGVGGTINPSGTYTAPSSGTGTDTVKVTSGSAGATATVTVVNGSQVTPVSTPTTIYVGATAYAFSLGSDGNVYVDSGSGSTWGGWASLPNNVSSFVSISATVYANGQTVIPEVFAVNSSGTYVSLYLNSAWGSWATLNGPGGSKVSAYSQSNGYQYVGVLGAGGTVSAGVFNNSSWTWAGTVGGQSGFASISMTIYTNGQTVIPEVFAVNSSGVYVSLYLNSAWGSLVTVNGPGGSQVSAYSQSNGYQYVGVLGANGTVSAGIFNNSSWTWAGTAGGQSGFTSISMTVYTNGQTVIPEVFAVNSSGTYVSLYLNSAWGSLGTFNGPGGSQVCAYSLSNGYQYVYVLGTSGSLSVGFYNNSSWTWVLLGAL